MTKTLFMAVVLLTFGTLYLTIDYSSMPSNEDRMWKGEFKLVTYKELGNPSQSLTIALGDGFISNIESIFIHLSLLFGAFRLVDFIFLFEPKKDIDISKVKQKFRKIINKIKNNSIMEN